MAGATVIAVPRHENSSPSQAAIHTTGMRQSRATQASGVHLEKCHPADRVNIASGRYHALRNAAVARLRSAPIISASQTRTIAAGTTPVNISGAKYPANDALRNRAHLSWRFQT